MTKSQYNIYLISNFSWQAEAEDLPLTRAGKFSANIEENSQNLSAFSIFRPVWDDVQKIAPREIFSDDSAIELLLLNTNEGYEIYVQ